MSSTGNNIVIFGAGYVGLTTAVLFANSGQNVTLIEINPERLKILQGGKSFFYEAGIDELLQSALAADQLSIVDDSKKSLQSADIIFCCVGTPDNPDGSPNLTYVFSVAKTVSAGAKDGAIFAQKSTVPVGTGKKIEDIFETSGKTLHYVTNSEFLREGTAIADSLWFDRVVVGGSDKDANKKVANVYRAIEKQREHLAKIAKVEPIEGSKGDYIHTDRSSAELIKVTSNAFLALKISFANSIAKFADHTGADIVSIMDAVGADKRIGRAFLNAGRGYGGGCFPKDVSGLIDSAAHHGVDMHIMMAVQDTNDSMPGYIANRTKDKLGGSLEHKKLCVLGLAFKPGTSDIRRSPGVKLANSLHGAGAYVTVYDPHANGEAKEDLRSGVTISADIFSAAKDCDGVLIATEWQDFITMDFEKLRSVTKGTLFVDAVNACDKHTVSSAGFDYLGVGRS